MTQQIEIEPSSVKRLLGVFLLSIALILSISTVTDKRIELNTNLSSVELRSINEPVFADAVPEILKPVEAPEPISEPKPAEVVQTPAPVVQAPVEPPAPPKPVEKPKPVVKPKKTPQPVITADNASLMAQAGISPSDYRYVQYIIGKEAGFNRPCVVNGGAIDCDYSGPKAYGVCQSKPGNKMATAGADWRTNPVTQLKWCNQYAHSRYGGWSNAYAEWLRKHWW